MYSQVSSIWLSSGRAPTLRRCSCRETGDCDGGYHGFARSCWRGFRTLYWHYNIFHVFPVLFYLFVLRQGASRTPLLVQRDGWLWWWVSWVARLCWRGFRTQYWPWSLPSHEQKYSRPPTPPRLYSPSHPVYIIQSFTWD